MKLHRFTRHTVGMQHRKGDFLQTVALFVVCAVTLVFGSSGIRAFADTPSSCASNVSVQDCNAVVGNWVNWAPEDNNGVDCGDPTVALVGSGNEQMAFNFFIGQGLSPIAAAGIVGNLKEESHIDPINVQNGKDSSTIPPAIYGKDGYGIAQWTSAGRQQNLIKYAKENGAKLGDPSGVPGNLTVQLNFLWQEATTGYATVLTHVKAATTPGDAATQWMGPNITGPNRSGGFENPNAAAAHEDVRRQNAEDAYKLYGSSTPAAVAASTGTANAQCAAADISADGFIEYKQCIYRQFPKAIQLESKQWADKPYGHSTVCDAGCGPSSMAMIITNLTGQHVTPDMTASYGAAHGTQEALPNSGSNWNIAQVVGDHWGLKSQDLGTNAAAITRVLQSGGLVLASGKGSPNPFTDGGHFIVIRAVTSSGEWMTGNSAGFDSSKPYTVDHIMAYLKGAWGLTKQ